MIAVTEISRPVLHCAPRLDRLERNLRLVAAVGLELVWPETEVGGDVGDRTEHSILRELEVRSRLPGDRHDPSFRRTGNSGIVLHPGRCR